MSEEQEYTVEAILQAKVAQKRNGKISWKYLVKWRDYDDPAENTWEPPQSFLGSEHFIDSFWNKVNLDGRDRDDPEGFKLNEVIHPIGPPAPKRIKKPRRKSDGDAPAQSVDGSGGPEASEPEVESILESKRGTSTHERSQRGGRSTKEVPQKAHRKTIRRKSLPAKPKRSGAADNAASTSVSSKKRKFEPSNPSDDDGTVLVPLTKIGPPKGVKRKRNLTHDFTPKLPADESSRQNLAPTATEIIRNQTPTFDPDQSGHGELTIDALFSSPSTRTAPRSSGIFSSLAVESASDHGMNSEHGSNKSKTPIPSIPRVPAHRARTANPLVKMMDEPDLSVGMEGAISVKTKLFAQTAAATSKPPSSSSNRELERPTAGASRTSEGMAASTSSEVQVISNGTIHDVSGLENVRVSSSEPSKLSLEASAGLDQAKALVAFEDEAMQVDILEQVATEATDFEKTSISKRSSLLDSGKNTSWSASFGQSSIFGLLGIGSSSNTAPLLQDFFPLNLDSSVSVSVVLKDPNAASSLDLPPLGTIIAQTPRSPPGKFYKPEPGAVLLDTLKTGGPSARLVLKEANDEIAVQHYDRFRRRLEIGDIFIAMAGPNIMAIVSSENQGICERLGIPTVLRGLVSEIIVSAVVIENHSAYAEAALLADNHRWL